MAPAWYVARTGPRAEYLARDQLERKGIEYFLPVVSTSSPRQGREDAPLFPGYLFLRDDRESLGRISLHAMPGLIGLVTFDGVAALVPDDVIGGLRQRVAEMNGSGGLRQRFRPDDPVWIRWGSSETEDLAQVVSDAKSPQGRVRVLMEFMGGLVHADVPQSNIRPARDDEASRHQFRVPFHRRTRGKGRYVHGVEPGSSHNERHLT